MIEAFYMTLALLLLPLFLAAGIVIAKSERLVEQLPPVLLTGAAGAGILLLLSPIWEADWLTDAALLIAAVTLALVLAITHRVEAGTE